MYSPLSSSQSRTLIAKRIPLCKHGVQAKLQVVKKGTRVGDRFYECALSIRILCFGLKCRHKIANF